MPEWLTTFLEVLLAALVAILFGAALGNVIDNYAASVDPSTPYYSKEKAR